MVPCCSLPVSCFEALGRMFSELFLVEVYGFVDWDVALFACGRYPVSLSLFVPFCDAVFYISSGLFCGGVQLWDFSGLILKRWLGRVI